MTGSNTKLLENRGIEISDPLYRGDVQQCFQPVPSENARPRGGIGELTSGRQQFVGALRPLPALTQGRNSISPVI